LTTIPLPYSHSILLPKAGLKRAGGWINEVLMCDAALRQKVLRRTGWRVLQPKSEILLQIPCRFADERSAIQFLVAVRGNQWRGPRQHVKLFRI
jgi:hypothetical protein